MSYSNEFSENFYVKEYLTYYAGLVANLTEGLEKEAKENLNQLGIIDMKAKNILIPVSYNKFKKRKANLIKSFNDKLMLKLKDNEILKSIEKAESSIKKLNI